ncbi:MAG: hypothetical protein ACUVQ7_10390 [bacterium]
MDLFVVTEGRPEHPLQRRAQTFKAIKDVAARYEVDIAPIGKTPEQIYSYLDPLYFDLYAGGITLCDKKGDFKKLLREIGQKIEEQGWMRLKLQHGSYGWRLKGTKVARKD